jgi:hypothetical protein
MSVDERKIIKAIREKELSQRTDEEKMIYEYYYLAGNISEICVEVGKMHIEPDEAIETIREMIGDCWDRLEWVEHHKGEKI